MIEERHFIYRLIKLQIQSITEAPVEVLRAGFRKDVKLMSIIPGKLKGQPHQLSFKFIRSANRLPMHPSSTLRPVVEHDPARCLRLTLEEILWTLEGFFAARDPGYLTAAAPNLDEFLFLPVAAGFWRQHELWDGTYTLDDLLDIAEHDPGPPGE